MVDRITLCANCRERAGEGLAGRLRGLLPGVEVRLTECLNACGVPLALAVTGEGKAAYFFAGVDPDGQAEEVVAFMELFALAPAGEVADARACGRLRFCLRGRIPA